MNTVTITEANRKFTHLTKQVDEEGAVAITKEGEVKYILMTRKEFRKMNRIYGKVKDGIICLETGDTVKLWKIAEDKDAFVSYEADKESLEMSEGYISIKPKEFFKVSFWEDLLGETDPLTEEIISAIPDNLPEYEISVESKSKTWE